MDPFDREKTAEVWRRVLNRRDLSPPDPGALENRIMEVCQVLYRRGISRRTVSYLYRQSENRKKILQRYGLVSRPAPFRTQDTPTRNTLYDLLGQAALVYDPADMRFGEVFAVMREQCIRGQKMLRGSSSGVPGK